MCGKLRSGLQLRVQPVGNVGHDLLPVELHQQLVARAGVELLLDVLYPGSFQAVNGALDAFALFAHRVGVAGQEKQGQVFWHPGQNRWVVQPQDAR